MCPGRDRRNTEEEEEEEPRAAPVSAPQHSGTNMSVAAEYVKDEAGECLP